MVLFSPLMRMSVKLKPENDGVDHINIYSKGKTTLGRFLTNFAYSPIDTEDGKFNSIEGYWYFLGCGDESLRKLSGFLAKKVGRDNGSPDWQDTEVFKRKILDAIDNKLQRNSQMKDLLIDCKLPLVHYYVYGNKVVCPKDGQWILDHLKSYQSAKE